MPDTSPNQSRTGIPQPLWPNASLDELLALAAKKYALAFETVHVGGIALDILQIDDMRERLDKILAEHSLNNALRVLPLWAKIWPASLVLGHILSKAPKDASILEVGAGCGVAGLMAAASGCKRVRITDINEDALLFARINILKNRLQDRAEVMRVDLLQDSLQERFHLIIGAEILYLEELYHPLTAFLARHLSPCGAQSPEEQSQSPAHPLAGPAVLLATDQRRNAAAFLEHAHTLFHISHKHIGMAETDKPKSAAPFPSAGMKKDATPESERHRITLHRLALRT